MITDEHITTTADRYLNTYPNDKPALEPLLAALNANDGPLATRKRLAGHVTASGYVLDAAGHVLLIRHRGLGRLLQPGGHTEPADESLVEAAQREVTEETGLTEITPIKGDPIHIGIHRIPYSRTKDEPEHWHFDYQYAFGLTDATPTVHLQEEEVSGFIWLPVEKLPEATPRERLQHLTISSCRVSG